jgi:hypothetical protein
VTSLRVSNILPIEILGISTPELKISLSKKTSSWYYRFATNLIPQGGINDPKLHGRLNPAEIGLVPFLPRPRLDNQARGVPAGTERDLLDIITRPLKGIPYPACFIIHLFVQSLIGHRPPVYKDPGIHLIPPLISILQYIMLKYKEESRMKKAVFLGRSFGGGGQGALFS